MNEHPILFSAPMVRAILAGSKNQTRRVVKPQPTHFNPVGVPRLARPEGPNAVIACPYGQPGDRIWVRETFWAWGRWETRFSERKGRDEWHFVDMTLQSWRAYLFGTPDGWQKKRRSTVTPGWWKRPAIHMPRAASRILLEVTGVRVERLQAISEADALAEGIVQLHDGGFGLPAGEHYHSADPRQSYLGLWEAINGPGSVEANHWVWVVEFKRVTP